MQNQNYTRRDWIKQTSALAAGLSLSGIQAKVFADLGKTKTFAPVRAITKGPKHHWFGYYDKQQFDPTNRYVLSNEVNFEHRSPRASDQIQVGMIDLFNNDQWIPLGKSDAWGWQQGCMLQWRPKNKAEVVWNDRENGSFVCHLLNISTKEKRTLDRPVYTISPDGKTAVTTDFERIQNMRPGYGYAGVEDANKDQQAPKNSGIWKVDLETGESNLLISYHDLAQIPYRGEKLKNCWHYVNHLLISPDSKRFIFLHRWRPEEGSGKEKTLGRFVTKMFTANLDGSDLYELDPSGNTSHFIWKDPEHICAWTEPIGMPSGFYLFKDKTQKVEPVGPELMTVNGHNTYLPKTSNSIILNDTYPSRPDRLQTLYLYDVLQNKRTDLGAFHSPPEYTGEWRCDLHPRSSRDGKLVTIDSPHGGEGRQVWLVDLSELV
ncbi:Hypothetical protein PBC10988_20370 [Planctomycetales bacterium 10988]|nr:Hypothetical protein PBC10988_20370 [Planctomycetales bacterium 10988]